MSNSKKLNQINDEKVMWLDKDKLFSEAISKIKPVMIGFDIGTGIAPHDYLKTTIYVCCEPCEEYIKILKDKTKKDENRNYVILQKDWMKSIENLYDNSIDSVYLIDVIEHLEKEEGKKLLLITERVVRQQIVIFTPLGFMKNEIFPDGKDAWRLDSAKYQEHKSGWLPEDFDDTWKIYACTDYHMTNNIGEKLDNSFGALWAIKNIDKKLKPSELSINSLPTEVKDALLNRFQYQYFNLLEKFKESKLQELEESYNQLVDEHQRIVNSKAVRWSNKIRKLFR